NNNNNNNNNNDNHGKFKKRKERDEEKSNDFETNNTKNANMKDSKPGVDRTKSMEMTTSLESQETSHTDPFNGEDITSPQLLNLISPGARNNQQNRSQFCFPNKNPNPNSNSDSSEIMTKDSQSDISPRTPSMIDHVVGRVCSFAKTQSGSRFVQEKLSETKYFQMFFEELQEHVPELMMDNFGHYAIEALFNHCNDEQRIVLVDNLRESMVTVACHKQGSFSIQAMMDTLSTTDQKQYLIQGLQMDIKKIILNHSGHYVILRFLTRFKYPDTKFIFKAISQYALELATDHYGLRVLKDAVEQGQTQLPSQDLLAVYMSIAKHTNSLVENQYGNYIIQHLLDVAPREVTDTIKEKMHGKFVRYSKQKFSSNVVEKCLKHSSAEVNKGIANKDWRRIIIQELLTKVADLITDKYANYCLQTALETASSDPELLSKFNQATKPHLEHLRENVKAKWMKLIDIASGKCKNVSNDSTVQSDKTMNSSMADNVARTVKT
ncbi:hypothetical protein RFI_26601, partial [Reticulomyxa filosa]